MSASTATVGMEPCGIIGQILPDFAVPSSRGEMIRASDFRGRKALVLVLAGGASSAGHRQLLAELSRAYGALRAEDAEVVAVLRVTRNELETQDLTYPFIVLADEAGSVHQRFGCDGTGNAVMPLVVLADRYGEICATSREEPGLAASVAPILAWLEFINSLCPE
jgi:peroxiredoxin